MMTKQMLNDPRLISAVWRVDERLAKVGENYVTKIVVYGEPSHYCDRPFIAIYEGDHLRSRHDATGCEIFYAAPEPSND